MCRQASQKASLLLDSTILDESRTPLKLPGFERVVMLAATKALETWREEALEGMLHYCLVLSLCLFTLNHSEWIENVGRKSFGDIYTELEPSTSESLSEFKACTF